MFADVILFTQDTSFQFSQAERDFDLVFSSVKSARALAASYNIQQNLHGERHIDFRTL